MIPHLSIQERTRLVQIAFTTYRLYTTSEANNVGDIFVIFLSLPTNLVNQNSLYIPIVWKLEPELVQHFGKCQKHNDGIRTAGEQHLTHLVLLTPAKMVLRLTTNTKCKI